jgi:hypothetical protein
MRDTTPGDRCGDVTLEQLLSIWTPWATRFKDIFRRGRKVIENIVLPVDFVEA